MRLAGHDTSRGPQDQIVLQWGKVVFCHNCYLFVVCFVLLYLRLTIAACIRVTTTYFECGAHLIPPRRIGNQSELLESVILK